MGTLRMKKAQHRVPAVTISFDKKRKKSPRLLMTATLIEFSMMSMKAFCADTQNGLPSIDMIV